MEINSDLVQFKSGRGWTGTVQASALPSGFEMGDGFTLVSTKTGNKYPFKVESTHKVGDSIKSWICRAVVEPGHRLENCEIEVFNI